MAITVGGVVKAVAAGAAVCAVAVIAPIGVPTVAALTLAAAGASLFVDNVGDELTRKDDEKHKK